MNWAGPKGRVGRLAWLLALAGVAWGPGAAAQTSDNSTVPGEQLTVRLLTAGPGQEVWERFGHNAIWLHDSQTGRDIVYDYGRFDFAEPGFLTRFVQGRMEYWMGSADPQRMVGAYAQRDRTVWVQELALPPAARERLRLFLEDNIKEENRFYRYDYYRDNCSTRLRDALDQALDGAIAAQATDTVPGSTYRWHSDRLLAPDPLAYTGTKLGLGRRTDLPISLWDEMYVPMKLQEHLRSMTIVADDGTEVPLVRREEVVYQGGVVERATPPGWYFGYLVIGMAWAALMVWSAGAAARGSGWGRWGYRLSAGGWALVAGAGGCVLLFLWFGTDHLMTRANENVLQLNPLALLLLPAVPLALRHPRWIKPAFGVTGLVAAGSILAALAKLVPGNDQANWQIIALALPLNTALWFSLRQRLVPAAGS